MIENVRFFIKGMIEVGAALFCMSQFMRWLMFHFTAAFSSVGWRRR